MRRLLIREVFALCIAGALIGILFLGQQSPQNSPNKIPAKNSQELNKVEEETSQVRTTISNSVANKEDQPQRTKISALDESRPYLELRREVHRQILELPATSKELITFSMLPVNPDSTCKGNLDVHSLCEKLHQRQVTLRLMALQGLEQSTRKKELPVEVLIQVQKGAKSEVVAHVATEMIRFQNQPISFSEAFLKSAKNLQGRTKQVRR